MVKFGRLAKHGSGRDLQPDQPGLNQSVETVDQQFVEYFPRFYRVFSNDLENSAGTILVFKCIKHKIAMGENKRSIEVLTSLIKINNDRIVGYQKAASYVNPSNVMLKTLFYHNVEESHTCKKELLEKVAELGGDPANEMPTTGGKIHRAWMDVKATFFGRDCSAMLDTCLFGEEAVQKAYKEAVQVSEGFPEEIRDLIRIQKSLLKMSRDLICNMKNQYQEVAETIIARS